MNTLVYSCAFDFCDATHLEPIAVLEPLMFLFHVWTRCLIHKQDGGHISETELKDAIAAAFKRDSEDSGYVISLRHARFMKI